MHALESITWEKWSRLIKSPLTTVHRCFRFKRFDLIFISFRGRWQQHACEEYNYFFCLRPAIEWPALPCCNARTQEESDVQYSYLYVRMVHTVFGFLVRSCHLNLNWKRSIQQKHACGSSPPRQTAYSDFIATFLGLVRWSEAWLKLAENTVLAELLWEKKTLFQLKKEAEQAEYGVSRIGPIYLYLSIKRQNFSQFFCHPFFGLSPSNYRTIESFFCPDLYI